jgi:YD repeat-containing protein
MQSTQNLSALHRLLKRNNHIKLGAIVLLCIFSSPFVLAKSNSVVTFSLSQSQQVDETLPIKKTLAIPFKWRYLPNKPSQASTMGYQWRHQFEVRLIANDELLEIIDESGNSLLFQSIEDDLYEGDIPAMGSIIKDNNYFQWITGDQQTLFYGSYPVTINKKGIGVVKLRYEDGLLAHVFDNQGHSVNLRYNNNQSIDKLIHTNGETISFEYDQYHRLASSSAPGIKHNYAYSSAPPVAICLPSYSQAEDQTDEGLCDDKDSEPSKAYELASSDAVFSKIDLRPSSCKSYFIEYNSIDRGVEIENGLFKHSRYASLIATVRSFPVVDFIDDREVVAVYSKDLNSRSYDPLLNPEGLYKSIVLDADKANRLFLNELETAGFVTAKENGQVTTLYKNQIDSLRMELVIQAGMATPSHLAQIESARQTLWSQHKIRLVVVQIP